MYKDDFNVERYIIIVCVCFKVINDIVEYVGSCEEKIQVVYQVIDMVFQVEFLEYWQFVVIMGMVLERIVFG